MSPALYLVDSTVPIESVVEKKEVDTNVCKLDGVLVENGKSLVFISQHGKVDSVKIGDPICDCDAEIIQDYSPGETDGRTDHSVDKYEYRIKMRFEDREEVFKNGEVICEEVVE